MQKNISLWIGLAIPVLMIVFVAAAIYLPRIFAESPQYDFVYMLNGYSQPYGYGYDYAVRNGTLTRTPIVLPPEALASKPEVIPESQFFVYDAQADTTKEISFDDAVKLKLDSSYESPDGFQVQQGNYSGEFFPFFGGGYNDGIYLEGGGVSRKINVNVARDPYRYQNFQFLGWVIPQ